MAGMDDDPTSRSTKGRKVAGALLVVAAGVIVFAAVAGDEDSPATPGGSTTDSTVVGDSPATFRYHDRVTTAAGDRAEVTNDDDAPHTYTSDDGLFDSGTLSPGGSASFPSLPPGTYGYHCEIHPALTGQLVITG